MTNVSYYDEETYETHIKKNQYIISNFRYKGTDFYLTSSDKLFDVCISNNQTLFSVWCHRKDKYLPGEIISMFRDGYDKNGVDTNKINLFINNPKNYIKKNTTIH